MQIYIVIHKLCHIASSLPRATHRGFALTEVHARFGVD